MRKADVLKLSSMPMAGPSYPEGPYRFINREYLVITYRDRSETDPRGNCLNRWSPSSSRFVHYEWIKMPDSSGFSSYTESGVVIHARFRGEEVNFVSQMYLDDDPPIMAGREIWGFPKKYAHWKLEVVKDTLHRHPRVRRPARGAMGTMGYKHEAHGERHARPMTRATLVENPVRI